MGGLVHGKKPGLTHHFLQEIHVQSQEYDNCFQIVPLVDMVKLLFGFCRLSLLNTPWSTVHLL